MSSSHDLISRIEFRLIEFDNRLRVARRNLVRVLEKARDEKALACLPIDTIQEINGLLAAERSAKRRFERYGRLAGRYAKLETSSSSSLPW